MLNWWNILLVYLSVVECVKFPVQNAISVVGDALKVGEYTSLSCNFIKWKQESVNKLQWSISYGRDEKTPMFSSMFEDGGKEVFFSPSFLVDKQSSGEKVLRLLLNDTQEAMVNICCNVEAVRDSGYGMLKKNDQEKCVSIPVIAGNTVPTLRVSVGSETIRVGDTLLYLCEFEDRAAGSMLAVLVNGEEINRSKTERSLRSNFTVLEQHFSQGHYRGSGHQRTAPYYQGGDELLFLECTARRGDQLLSKQEAVVKRDRTFATTSRPAYQHTNNQFPHSQARSARFYADPKNHGNHGRIPCASYVVLEDYSTEGTIITGDLPIEIQGHIIDLKSSGNSYMSGEDAVQVLNILGYSGYRVVAMSLNPHSRMSWTLERKYFEFHQDDLLHN